MQWPAPRPASSAGHICARGPQVEGSPSDVELGWLVRSPIRRMGRQWTYGLSVGHGIAVSGAPKQMSNLLGDQLGDSFSDPR